MPGDVATAEDQNTQDGDIATGLTNCVTRDGQSPATANIPMGGHKLTNLGGGSATSDSATLGQVAQFVPTGVVFPYGGASAPTGWLLCDGSAVSRATWFALFAAIGTTYGAGDGSTTFNLPDARGRTITGADDMGTGAAGRLTGATMSSITRGGSGGFELITLDASTIPAHTHTAIVTDPGHTHSETTNTGSTAGPGVLAVGTGPIAGTTGSNTTGITVVNNSTGAGGSHINVQPTLLFLAIIKT